MTVKEKCNFLNRFIDEHYGQELAEWLYAEIASCTSDEDLAILYDKYLCD